MPHPTHINCAFDPAMCPLLQGLPPDEQRFKMENDPLIRACMGRINGGADYPVGCVSPKPAPTAKSRSGPRNRNTVAAET